MQHTSHTLHVSGNVFKLSGTEVCLSLLWCCGRRNENKNKGKNNILDLLSVVWYGATVDRQALSSRWLPLAPSQHAESAEQPAIRLGWSQTPRGKQTQTNPPWRSNDATLHPFLMITVSRASLGWGVSLYSFYIKRSHLPFTCCAHCDSISAFPFPACIWKSIGGIKQTSPWFQVAVHLVPRGQYLIWNVSDSVFHLYKT